MIKTTTLLLIGLLGLLTCTARAVDINGQWRAGIQHSDRYAKIPFHVPLDAGKVAGKAAVEVSEQKREAELKEAKLDGDTLTFVETINIQDNDVRIQYTGKVGTNEISFTRQVGDFATEEFKATRVAPPAVTNTAAADLPPEPRAAFGRPIVLGPDDKHIYTNPPAGFDVGRNDIPHGKLEMMTMIQKPSATRVKH